MSRLTASNIGANGMTYDFGVQIARGTVSGLATTVLAVSALTGSILTLIDATNQFDESMKRNQISFGGYTNTLKAMQFTADKIASGKSPFEQDDLMTGMRNLQRAGISVRKNFDLVNKAADAAGGTFTEMAQTIRNGDFNALADMGIITDRTVVAMQQLPMTAQQASAKVLSILNQAKGKGMFENTIRTFPQILRRFKQFGIELSRAIVGDPLDPNGLAYQIKAKLNYIADLMYASLDKIRKVGAIIGRVLLFTVNVVGDFLKRVARNVASLFKVNDKFWENFQEKMRSFDLYLGIMRAKINYFFDTYGTAIKNFLKIVTTLFILRYVTGLLFKGITALNAFAVAMQFAVLRAPSLGKALMNFLTMGRSFGPRLAVLATNLRGLGSALALVTSEIWASTVAFLASPIGWIVIAIVALGVAIYACIKYWDEIRLAVVNFGDEVVNVISIFNPFIGVILTGVQAIIENWNSFKTIFINLWVTCKNYVMLAILTIKQKFRNLVEGAKQLWSNLGAWITNIWEGITGYLKDKLGWVYTDIIEPIGNAIGNFFGFIWKKISQVFDWIQEKWKKLKSWFGSLIGDMADASADMASNSAAALAKKQQEMGITPDVSTGTNAFTENINDAQRQINEGKIPADVLKTMDPRFQNDPAFLQQFNALRKQATGTSTTPTVLPSGKMPSITPDMFPKQSGSTVISSGAVQINLNGSNMDPKVLAKLVRQELEKLRNEDKIRSGKSVNGF